MSLCYLLKDMRGVNQVEILLLNSRIYCNVMIMVKPIRGPILDKIFLIILVALLTTCLLKREIIVILEGKVGILKVKIGSCNSNFSWPASFSYKYTKRFAMVFSKDKWSRLQAKRNPLKKPIRSYVHLTHFCVRYL